MFAFNPKIPNSRSVIYHILTYIYITLAKTIINILTIFKHRLAKPKTARKSITQQ